MLAPPSKAIEGDSLGPARLYLPPSSVEGSRQPRDRGRRPEPYPDRENPRRSARATDAEGLRPPDSVGS